MLSEMQIEAINVALKRGYRIELIPVENGKVKIMKIKRETIKAEKRDCT